MKRIGQVSPPPFLEGNDVAESVCKEWPCCSSFPISPLLHHPVRVKKSTYVPCLVRAQVIETKLPKGNTNTGLLLTAVSDPCSGKPLGKNEWQQQNLAYSHLADILQDIVKNILY